jgi:hypothetical protein
MGKTKKIPNGGQRKDKKTMGLLVLWVLCKYSSKSKKLTQEQIADYLESDYQVKVDRKSVSHTLRMLDQLFKRLGKTSPYALGGGHGVYLSKRPIDPDDLPLLFNVFYSSNSLSKQECDGLLAKFERAANIKMTPQMSGVFKTAKKADFGYTDAYANILDLQGFIKDHAWISYVHEPDSTASHFKGEISKQFNQSSMGCAKPLCIVSSGGYYYVLLAAPHFRKENSDPSIEMPNVLEEPFPMDGGETFAGQFVRLDKMDMKDSEELPIGEVEKLYPAAEIQRAEEFAKNFDIKAYLDKHPVVYEGWIERADRIQAFVVVNPLALKGRLDDFVIRYGISIDGIPQNNPWRANAVAYGEEKTLIRASLERFPDFKIVGPESLVKAFRAKVIYIASLCGAYPL